MDLVDEGICCLTGRFTGVFLFAVVVCLAVEDEEVDDESESFFNFVISNKLSRCDGSDGRGLAGVDVVSLLSFFFAIVREANDEGAGGEDDLVALGCAR